RVWVGGAGARRGGGSRCRGGRSAVAPPWPASLGRRHAAPILDPDPAHLGQRTADTENHVVTRGHPGAAAVARRWLGRAHAATPAARPGLRAPVYRHRCVHWRGPRRGYWFPPAHPPAWFFWVFSAFFCHGRW